MSVIALFLLSCFTITAQGQNCSKPVGGPNMSLKGDAILQDTFPDGSTVSFACDLGYTPAGGSPTITCTAGNWSALTLVCERKSCGPLKEVDNANIDYPDGGVLYGDTAVVTCNQGYILVGNRVIRCGDKGWMDRLPVCEVVKCPTPGLIANGTFSPQKETYNYKEVVQYSCNNGFTLNGSRQSVCSEDEKFNPEPPTCVWVECKDPVILNAEFVEGSRPPHTFASTITYSCNPGYNMIGEATIKCDINSQWSPGIPECKGQNCSKPVGGPNMSLKGDAILQDTFLDGSNVSFACDLGYTSAGGSSNIMCTAGKWSTLTLVCERKSCGPLQVDNANIDYPDGGVLFGDTAVVTCNKGYILVGNRVIRCGDKGWIDRLPVCEVVKCPTPGLIANGTFSPQKETYNYKEVVQYSCNNGFTLNGSKESVCSEDEKFNPEPPTCVWVECKDPVILNAEFVEGSRPPHTFASTITYSCNPGYNMIGEATIKCDINSQWSPGIPECKSHGNALRTGIIVVVVVSLFFLIVLLVIIWRKKKSKHSGHVGPTQLDVKMSSREESPLK